MKKIFSWIVTLSAAMLVFWFCRLLIQAKEALAWPQTTGEVISSSLTIEHLPKFMDFNADPLRWYGVDVKYQYSVDDQTYVSHRLGIHDTATGSAKSALKVMNQYRRRHEVKVFYNPADPRQAVLEPWNIGDIFMPAMAGILLLILGFFVCLDNPLEIKTSGEKDYLYWGNTYQKLKKFDQALIEFNKIIEISPHLAQGYKSRGGLFLQQGRWDEAIADLNHARSIDPADAKVYFNLAQAYLGNKEYNKAWVPMQKALEMGIKVKPEMLEEIQKNLTPDG